MLSRGSLWDQGGLVCGKWIELSLTVEYGLDFVGMGLRWHLLKSMLTDLDLLKLHLLVRMLIDLDDIEFNSKWHLTVTFSSLLHQSAIYQLIRQLT